MSKRVVTLIAVMTVYTASWCCDVCGCAAGINNVGILPGFNKHFMAIRWNERSFVSSHIAAWGVENKSGNMKSREYFNTIDLWGRYYVHNRIQLFAFIPFSVNIKNTLQYGAERFIGLSDVSLISNYILINTTDSIGRKVKHNVMIGGGIKLPTGAYGIKDRNETLIPNMQPGTGSFDMLLNLVYNMRLRSYGLNYDVNYRINTPNRHQYRFGNKMNTSLRAFYWYNVKRSVLMPHGGFYFEHGMKDFKHGIKRIYTGGYVFMTTVGMDVYIGNIGMALNYMHPLKHRIAEGYVRPQQQFTVTLNYLFSNPGKLKKQP
jgi:hypothetical protein